VGDHLRTNECVSFSILPDNRSAARMARGHGIALRLDDGSLDGVVTRPAGLPYELPRTSTGSRPEADVDRRVA
jgi:hypothetical protein